jgi:hypothetical protein
MDMLQELFEGWSQAGVRQKKRRSRHVYGAIIIVCLHCV